MQRKATVKEHMNANRCGTIKKSDFLFVMDKKKSTLSSIFNWKEIYVGKFLTLTLSAKLKEFVKDKHLQSDFRLVNENVVTLIQRLFMQCDRNKEKCVRFSC